jgi:hypothetical protein
MFYIIMLRMSDMKQTSIYLDQIDREAIEIIKAHFGVSTNSDAVRLAIRKVAREIASMKGKDDE